MDPVTTVKLAIEYLAVLLAEGNFMHPQPKEVERIRKFIEEELKIPQ